MNCPGSALECRCSCKAIIGIFQIALMGHQQQRELSFLRIQNLVVLGSILFSVTLIQAHSGAHNSDCWSTGNFLYEFPTSHLCKCLLYHQWPQLLPSYPSMGQTTQSLFTRQPIPSSLSSASFSSPQVPPYKLLLFLFPFSSMLPSLPLFLCFPSLRSQASAPLTYYFLYYAWSFQLSVSLWFLSLSTIEFQCVR